MRRYVRRLAEAGVVGLGFAVGRQLRGGAAGAGRGGRGQGLPLLEVPRRTPFIAISKAVSAAVAADQYRAVTAGFEAQRELTRAALSADGTGELLARLAAHLDGWAALYDASGAVVAAAPDWAARRAARLTADVGAAARAARPGQRGRRRRRRRPRTGSSCSRWAPAAAPRGALAVGTAAPLGTADRYAVHSAIALLTLTTERSRSLQDAEQRLGAAVLRMLLAGEPDHARAVAGRLYGGLLDAPYRMLIAEAPPMPRRGHRVGAVSQARRRPPRWPAGSRTRWSIRAPRRTCGRGRARRPRGRPAGAARAGRRRRGRLRCVRRASSTRRTADRPAGAARPGRVAAAAAGASGAPSASGGATGLFPASPHPPVSSPPRPPTGRPSRPCRWPAAAGRALVEHERVAAGSVLPLLADDAVRAFADGLLRAAARTRRHMAAATWSPPCVPGSPTTGSGTRPPPTSASTGTPCATACGASRRSWAARWTTPTSAWSCGWP